MNILHKYKILKEAAGSVLYDSGVGYTARVIHKNGVHTTKFFKNGVHMQDCDYEGLNKDDAHGFAKEEMEFRKKEHSKNVTERILEPQGHMETADHITDDSSKGHGPKKKMMGNHTPLEIIAKILAKEK